MRISKLVAWLLILGGTSIVLAQSSPTPSSATVTLTVTAAATAVPATIKATLANATVQAGNSATLTIKASGNVGIPSGSITLEAEAPGVSTFSVINTFPLTSGTATCVYPISANATPGAYLLKAVYVPPKNGAYY
jgi:hypothetical protein